jgi:hypothetical protein
MHVIDCFDMQDLNHCEFLRFEFAFVGDDLEEGGFRLAAEQKVGTAGSRRDRVNRRPIPWLGNRLPLGTTGFQPGSLGDLHFPESFLRCVAKRAARLEVGDVRDVAAVWFAVEYVDVVATHAFSVHRELEFFHVTQNPRIDSTCANDLADARPDFVEFGGRQSAHGAPYADFVGRDNSVGQGEAGTPKTASGLKIRRQDRHGLRMSGGLACDLAKDDITTTQRRQYHSRPDFGAGEIGERERHDDDFATYKSRHASSSSGVFQSVAQAVWAKGRRFSPPGFRAVCRAFKKTRKSKTSRCTVSGAVLISSISDLVKVLIGCFVTQTGPNVIIFKVASYAHYTPVTFQTSRFPGSE